GWSLGQGAGSGGGGRLPCSCVRVEEPVLDRPTPEDVDRVLETAAAVACELLAQCRFGRSGIRQVRRRARTTAFAAFTRSLKRQERARTLRIGVVCGGAVDRRVPGNRSGAVRGGAAPGQGGGVVR